MKLFNYYVVGILLSGLTGAILMLIVSTRINADYESEWITKEFAIQMDFFLSLIISFGYALAGLTIFLNKIEKVRKNPIYSFISWNLLPLLFTGLVLNNFINSQVYETQLDHLLFVSSLTVPYAIAFLLSYYLFRKKNYS